MPHPDTNALVERIFKDDRTRKRLYSHAARFFGRSVNRQLAGLDAHHLVSAVIDRVLEKGNLHKHPNPEAYLMKAITNAGIDAKARHINYQKKASQLLDPVEIAPLNHENEIINQLATSADIKDAILSLPERAQRVAQAKIDHPDLNINQLAELLGISRDTIRRAIGDMRNHELLRSLAQPESQPPPTTTHDMTRRSTHDRPDAA